MTSVVGPGIGSAMSNRSHFCDFAEVRRVEQLLEADDLRAARGGLAHARDGGLDGRGGVVAGGVLDDADGEGRWSMMLSWRQGADDLVSLRSLGMTTTCSSAQKASV